MTRLGKMFDRTAPGDRQQARLLLGAISIHLVLAILHGVTHAVIPVVIADWQTGFVAIAIFLTPLLGAVAVFSDRIRLAAGLLCLAGLAGFAFEAFFHFLVANPDHVAAVTTHRTAFGTTAGLSTVADLLLVLAGGWVLAR